MDPTPVRLDIRKYPNRRFYDASRSRHVTLPELHELVCAGHELVITDSQTGQNITNLVLTQILIERDADKLTLFPTQVMHQIVRTQAGMLGTVFESFVRQLVETQRNSQEQWLRFLQNTLGMSVPAASNPFEWARSAAEGLQPRTARPDSRIDAAAGTSPDAEMEGLRRQIADLSRRVEELTTHRRPRKPSKSTGRRPGRSET